MGGSHELMAGVGRSQLIPQLDYDPEGLRAPPDHPPVRGLGVQATPKPPNNPHAGRNGLRPGASRGSLRQSRARSVLGFAGTALAASA